jgi:hypothetical protein
MAVTPALLYDDDSRGLFSRFDLRLDFLGGKPEPWRRMPARVPVLQSSFKS